MNDLLSQYLTFNACRDATMYVNPCDSPFCTKCWSSCTAAIASVKSPWISPRLSNPLSPYTEGGEDWILEKVCRNETEGTIVLHMQYIESIQRGTKELDTTENKEEGCMCITVTQYNLFIDNIHFKHKKWMLAKIQWYRCATVNQ